MRSDGDEKRGWSSSWFTAGMAVLTCTPTGAHQHAAHRDGGCGQGQATPGPESAQKQARRVGQRDAIGTVHSTRAKERARSPPSRPAAPGNSSKRRCTCTSWPPGPPPAPPKCSHGLPERDKTASRQVARGRARGSDGTRQDSLSSGGTGPGRRHRRGTDGEPKRVRPWRCWPFEDGGGQRRRAAAAGTEARGWHRSFPSRRHRRSWPPRLSHTCAARRSALTTCSDPRRAQTKMQRCGKRMKQSCGMMMKQSCGMMMMKQRCGMMTQSGRARTAPRGRRSAPRACSPCGRINGSWSEERACGLTLAEAAAEAAVAARAAAAAEHSGAGGDKGGVEREDSRLSRIVRAMEELKEVAGTRGLVLGQLGAGVVYQHQVDVIKAEQLEAVVDGLRCRLLALAVAAVPSRRRDCRSAAPPSPFSRCFNRDGEKVSAK